MRGGRSNRSIITSGTRNKFHIDGGEGLIKVIVPSTYSLFRMFSRLIAGDIGFNNVPSLGYV